MQDFFFLFKSDLRTTGISKEVEKTVGSSLNPEY